MRLFAGIVAGALATLGFAGSLRAQDTLRVLHHTPGDSAAPSTTVTVMFDRPVAAALDSSVPASRVFRITPHVDGAIEWRDPITIRFIPSAPLAPGARYTIGIDTTIRAVDGTRLGSPYRFEFRVSGPKLLGRSLDGYAGGGGDTLAPDGRIQLLYSAPVDLDRLARGVRLELPGCAKATSVMLHPRGQHRVGQGDPLGFRYYYNGNPSDSITNRFRTVVELEPTAPLPLDCGGYLVIPTTADDSAFGREERYAVRTAPVFRLAGRDCWGHSSDELLVRFSAPVRRADVLRYVHVNDEPIVIPGETPVAKCWVPSVFLVPRATFTVRVDSAMHDIYGRLVEGPRTLPVRVDDYAPNIVRPSGILTIPRSGPLTLPVRSVNVRTIRMIAYRVPDSVRIQVMSAIAGVTDPMPGLRKVVPETTIVSLPDQLNADTTVDVPLPPAALAPDHPLVAFRIAIADSLPEIYPPGVSRSRHAIVLSMPPAYGAWYSPFALVQVTDLAVTARLVGTTNGSAIVTGLADGRPRRDVTVTQFDMWRRSIGRGVTNEQGVAALERLAPDTVIPQYPISVWGGPRFNVLQAESAEDRVTVTLGGRSIGYQSGSPLEPNVLGGRRDDSPLAAGAVITDRGIYRPAEVVYLKGIVRRGMLGALRLPSTLDSARLTVRRRYSFADDTSLVLRDTVQRVSSFGTIVDSVRLRPGLMLGDYSADLRVVIDGRWRTIGSAYFRLAEYRPTNFLVDLSQDTAIHYFDDTIHVVTRGQLLFGAPLRGGLVRWTAQMHQGGTPRPRGIPNDWVVGDAAWWNRISGNALPPPLTGVATLDAQGRARINIPVASLTKPASGWVTVSVGVTDVDQQAVTAMTTAQISSSRTYIIAHVPGESTWRIGQLARIDLRTVNESGMRIPGVVLRAVAEWHHQKLEDPYTNTPTVSVIDTVDDRRLTLDHGDGSFSFTPDSSGQYVVYFTATDSQGRPVLTSVVRSAVPKIAPRPPPVRTVPLGYRLVLTADSARFAVGDVAHVHFDSPFRDAEAWIAIEREGVIEERRRRVSRGDNVVDVRITEDLTPNVFVSVVLLARDELARPDSARERLRAGYLELGVKSDRHKLAVAVATDRQSYAPRDTAAIRISVRDAAGRGVRSEVAVWAVDEGVNALTGFQTPDVGARIYAPRGVGVPLWSTLPTLVTNDPMLVVAFLRQMVWRLSAIVEGAGGDRAQVGFAVASAPTVRSRFASTAFFLGRVETDDQGHALARASVPDNLTTFRVMAVAASADDRYGSGDTTLLVTRPLVARAVLPRFIRPTDSLVAGVVVTARDGRPRSATTDASAVGVALRGATQLSVSLTSTASSEARFVIQAPARDVIADTISVQLGASDGVTADATETRLPVRPDFHQRTHAMLGAVRDSQTLALALPPEIDPARSRMRLRIGTSRLSAMLAAYRWLKAYPYDCTEQISSVGRALIAVWRATKSERPDALGGDPHAKLQELVDEIAKRQRSDGAIKYWPSWEWSSPWLTSYAGLYLLDARDEGVSVDPTVIERIAQYLRRYSDLPVDTGGMNRYEQRARRLELGERVAAVDFLRRIGRPDTTTEHTLLRVAAVMTWEDRLRLAEVVAAQEDMRTDAESMVDAAWRAVTPAGHRADLPDSANGPREFPSRIAPAARLLSASLALRPTHPLLGALVETVLQQGRAESRFAWSTQDYASVVMALAHFGEGDVAGRVVTARAGTSSFVAHPPRSGVDTTIVVPLTGILETATNGDRLLRVHVDASAGERPVYYALEVDEIPLAAPVKPDIRGIVVERWYERFDNGAPVTRVAEGDLVRVRLRVTVPADREFVAVEDPLPAGLEPIDTGLRTSGLAPFATSASESARVTGDRDRDGPFWQAVLYGGWDDGHWSPWEHKELHDDRVSYFARMLWTGSYTASYVARATTAGNFVVPPAYAEEMYNPASQGRSAGGRFIVDVRP